MISCARTVELGSLASCPRCGGLAVLHRGWIQHLTGDTWDRFCDLRELLDQAQRIAAGRAAG